MKCFECRNQSGLYFCTSEREAKELMQRFAGYESDTPLFVAILGKQQHSEQQRWRTKLSRKRSVFQSRSAVRRKNSISTEKHGCGKIALAMNTAPPKAAWQPDCHRNLQAQISEHHDKDFFKKMATVHINIEKAKKLLGEEKRREKRKEAGKAMALAKETA